VHDTNYCIVGRWWLPTRYFGLYLTRILTYIIYLHTNCHPKEFWSRSFYRPDALPVTQPTASKHWRHRIIHSSSKHMLKAHVLVNLGQPVTPLIITLHLLLTSAYAGVRPKLYTSWTSCHQVFLQRPPVYLKLKIIALHGTPSQSYGESLAIWDHTVLPATQHKGTHSTSTTARQAGMEGWVDLGDWLHTEMVYPSINSHSSKY